MKGRAAWGAVDGEEMADGVDRVGAVSCLKAVETARPRE